MKSWEVLGEAINKVGVKVLAGRLGLSTALIYKWCQESTKDDPAASGARNPLDRLKDIYDITGDDRVINWLCNESAGFFVRNPSVPAAQADASLLTSTQRMVEDFGEMLAQVSGSWENDQQISADEADRIRQRWEALKTSAECFVCGCERGVYAKRKR